MITVFIAEDKDVMRVGLRQLVSSIEGCSVVGDAVNGDDVLPAVAALQPKVVLLKGNLPGPPTLSLTRKIKQTHPNVGVLYMLTEPAEFWQALDAKPDGYFMREVSLAALEPAVRTVAAGGAYLGPVITEYLLRGEGHRAMSRTVEQPSKLALSELSKREDEVMSELSKGKSNEEIAQSLGLSIQTVKVHVKHILKKLAVTDRTQAVIKALKNGY